MINLNVAIHGIKGGKGGIYNVLAAFHEGLYKGFCQNNISTCYLNECLNNFKSLNLVLGFNMSGFQFWENIMNSGIYNIMWTVDSVFAQNYELIECFANNPRFVLFEVTPADFNQVSYFMPNLQHKYLPHATDLNFWQKKDLKKEFDITFFSTVRDYEKMIDEIKSQMSKAEFDVFNDVYNLCLNNPNNSFHEIFAYYQNEMQLKISNEKYRELYKQVTYPLMYEQKVRMIRALKDFNVKIFGNETWRKYLSEKQDFMGSADVTECVDLMNKSKITLHVHPTQLAGGLHERFLNASATETFVLCSDTKCIKNEFEDNFGWFNSVNYDDIAQKAQYYLENEALRLEKAEKSRKIVEKKHIWENRVEEILQILF